MLKWCVSVSSGGVGAELGREKWLLAGRKWVAGCASSCVGCVNLWVARGITSSKGAWGSWWRLLGCMRRVISCGFLCLGARENDKRAAVLVVLSPICWKCLLACLFCIWSAFIWFDLFFLSPLSGRRSPPWSHHQCNSTIALSSLILAL